MRRYVLVLGPDLVSVRLVGGIPRLRSYWSVLSRSTGELFTHPLTQEVVADVRITAQQVNKSGSIGTAVAAAFDSSN